MTNDKNFEKLQKEIRRLENQSDGFKKLERAHRESERRLATLMANLPGIAYRCLNDRNWTMEFISDGCFSLTGYPAEDLIGNARISYSDLVHPEDRDMVWSAIQPAVREGERFTLTYRINCRDGQEKWVWEQGVGVFDSDGELVALEGFITDVTEQKNNEAALRREMNFVDTLLQAAPAFFVAIDYDGKVLMMNQAMLKALGYSAEEVIGRDYMQTFVPQSERAVLSEVFKTLTRPGGVTLHKNRMLTRSGDELLLEWQGRTVTDSEGKFRFFFGVGQDITEREEASRRSEEHVRFLAGLERIDRALRSSNDLSQMMSNVLGEILDFMECDRAWLLTPCDPEAESYRVPIERTRPEYPGAGRAAIEVPMTPDQVQFCREALASDSPVSYTEGTDRPVRGEVMKNFGVRSLLFMAVYPKLGQPWCLGVHQCSHPRVWSESDNQFLKAAARRVGDGLRSSLAFRHLAESEERLRSTLESIDDLVFVLDMDGVFEEFHQPGNRPLMYAPPEQYLGKNYKDIMPPEVASTIESAIAKVKETGKSKTAEYSLPLGGETRWFSTRLSLRRDVSGEGNGFTAIVRDITERRQAEITLRKQEGELSSILRAAPAGIGVVVNRVFKEVNRHLCEMTGYKAEELKGQDARMLYPDEKEYAYVGREKYRQIGEKRTGTVETRWQCKDGKIINILLSSTPINPENLEEGVTFTALDISVLKESQKALRESEARVRNIIDAIPMGIHLYELRDNGRLVFLEANEASDAIIGIDSREFEGKTIEEVVPPLADTNLLNRCRQIALEGGVEHWEQAKYVDPSGGSRTYEVAAFQTGPGRMACSFQDVTERTRAEKDIRDKEATLRALLNAPTESALLLDRDGVILAANEIAAARLGKPSDELEGISIADYFAEPVASSRMARCREVLETKAPVHFEDERAGRIFDNSIYPVFDTEGEVASLAVFGRDITETREAASALKASENRYRQLVETMTEGLALTDEDGKLTFANRSLCQMLGYTQQELLSKEMTDIFDPLNAQILNNQMSARKTGENSLYEISWTKKNGEKLATTISARPVLDEAGRFVGSLAVVADISERRRLEEQFHHAQRLETVGRLAAGIAHDFNNMLSPILCYAELVLNDLSKDDSRYDQLMEIQKAAERSRDLTQRLLAFSRKQVLELKPMSLTEMVMNFEKMLRGTLREDIEIKYYLDPEVPNIRGDVSQVEQVLMNLAVNAQHAMSGPGVLSIEVTGVEVDRYLADQSFNLPPGKYVQLSVADTGVGMDEETLQHIFEPFFTTRETGQGTGLGLATVYGIVKQHGGHIDVKSRANEGTEFRIYFPRTDDAVDEIAKKVAPDGSIVCNETIVVAEDEYMLRDLVCTVLGSLGYTVLSAATGKACLKLVEEYEGPIDLLITDVIMPELNGKQLYERMSQRVPDLKVLYFSGYAADIIADHGVLDEGLSFLKKPFSVAALTKKVREVIDS